MHTLLRHAGTGLYFQSLDRWTPDRDDAYDFGLIARAMRFAHKVAIPGLELILSFDAPERDALLSFKKFLPTRSRNRH